MREKIIELLKAIHKGVVSGEIICDRTNLTISGFQTVAIYSTKYNTPMIFKITVSEEDHNKYIVRGCL